MMENKLPEHAFPLQNKELERTDLYTFIGDQSKSLILFGLRGPGGMNCLWPVIKELTAENYPTYLLIDSAAKILLRQKRNSGFAKQPVESPLQRIQELRPMVVVTEFSAGGGVALPLTWTEQEFNVPIVWVEDFPGQPSSFDPNSIKINPSYLCTINERTRQMAIKNRPTMDPEHIMATGHPDFDKYSAIDKEQIRTKTRKLLKITEDEFLIVYSGQLPPATPGILSHLVDTLNDMQTDKKLVLLFSRHPRDTSEDSVYENILNEFKGRIINQGSIQSDDIGFAADLLATMNSTEGLKSVYRRVPSVHIMPTDLIGETKSDLIPLPVVAGASLGVYDYADLKEALEKSVNNKDFRQNQVKIMEAEFQTDGQAAQRVAEVIKKAASGQA